MTFTKRELIQRIWKDVGGQRQYVSRVVQSFIDEVIDDLARGKRIEFRDFGTFKAERLPSRRARNPRTGERVHVPDRTVIRFRAGRRMTKRAQAFKGRSAGPAPG